MIITHDGKIFSIGQRGNDFNEIKRPLEGKYGTFSVPEVIKRQTQFQVLPKLIISESVLDRIKKSIGSKSSNIETSAAINELEEGKGNRFQSIKTLMDDLNAGD